MTAIGVVVCGILVYVLHHLPGLDGHEVEVAAVAIGVAVGIALLVTLGVRDPAQQMPAVVVLRPGQTAVARLQRRHVAFAAALHGEVLDRGFFAALGPRFLRAYHRSFLASPHAVALVAHAGGHPIGFLVGILRPRAHRRWVLSRHGPRLAAAGALALVVRPVVLVRFARTRAL